jgi:hypothetical protein
MALEQQKVWEIVGHALTQKMDIPEFQRPFVWEPDQVKLLAESLYLEYPIGTFLLWDSSEYNEAKAAQGFDTALWVVDGQQRTTALCLLLGQKPYWWQDATNWNETLRRYDVLVNVMPPTKGSVEFALHSPERRADHRWVSIRDILRKDKVEALTPLAQELVEQVSGESAKLLEIFGDVHANLQGLWKIRDSQIPIIKISHEVEDVAEIFARLNREGTLIREADVILAVAAARNRGWVREQYLPFQQELEDRGWDLEAGVFIRTMTGISRGRARLKEVPKEFWSPPQFAKVWQQAKETISETLKRLAEFGILSTDIIPSKNSLIPLFAAHHQWKGTKDYRFENVFRWFLLANRDGRYTGAATTTLDEDCQAISRALNFDSAVETLIRRLRISPTFEAQEFLSRFDRAAGNRFLRLILYLVLYKREARDWLDGTRLGYDRSGIAVTGGFRPHWHHIFPRSMLRNAGIPDEEIHPFGNITVMNEATNVRRLSSKFPSRYIDEFIIPAERLSPHVIPKPFLDAAQQGAAAIEAQWNISNYRDFSATRAAELANAANAFLDELKGEPHTKTS